MVVSVLLVAVVFSPHLVLISVLRRSRFVVARSRRLAAAAAVGAEMMLEQEEEEARAILRQMTSYCLSVGQTDTHKRQ